MALVEAIQAQTARLAAKSGMSANAWILDEREAGRRKSRSSMLKIYRNANELQVKKDRLKYVRKDRFPSQDLVAQSDWDWSKEYAYKVQVTTVLSPDQPPEERFVTIMSDNPLTPGDIEFQVYLKWTDEEKYGGEQLRTVTPATAIHRIA